MKQITSFYLVRWYRNLQMSALGHFCVKHIMLGA